MIADAPPSGKGWLYEIKWDGVQAPSYIDDRRTEFYSRKGERITAQYAEFAEIQHRGDGRGDCG